MNVDVSKKVIDKVQSETRKAHKEFIRFSTISLLIYLLPLALTPLSGLFSKNLYILLTPNNNNALPWLIIWALAGGYFIVEYYDWRSRHRDAYIGDYLVRALEIGLMYQDNSKADRLRDDLAISIQRAAIRYPAIYKNPRARASLRRSFERRQGSAATT